MEYIQQFIAEHIPGVHVHLPEATYLLWVDFRGLGMDHAQLSDKLAHEAKLAFNDGVVFGEESAGFMRINAACPRATVEEAMRRLLVLVDK